MSSPYRSEDRARFIKTLPCSVCQSMRWVDPAHAPGQRGMSQKRTDMDLLPLCRRHHDEQHAGGWPAFILKHQLDIPAILATLQEKPHIVVRQMQSAFRMVPCYIALYKGEEFLLGRVEDGLRASLVCATDVCSEYLRETLLQKFTPEAA
jgi:hypothetical protein